MARIRSSGTKPERLARSLLTEMGYRYRLNRADLPGKPDIAFIGRKKLIFIHGCFWHGHDCRRGARQPAANAEYWQAKISRNMARDQKTLADLQKMGWACLIIWECEMKQVDDLRQRLASFLN